MSDGMSDSRALCELHERIEFATAELRDALKAAEEGHRGLTVRPQAIINEVLRGSGYRVVLVDE